MSISCRPPVDVHKGAGRVRLMWTGEGDQKPDFLLDVINGCPLYQSSFFYLNVYRSDMTPFNGILTIDRDTTTVRSSPDFEPYVANISEGFDDAVWKSHAKGWTKATDFDDPVRIRNRNFISSHFCRSASTILLIMFLFY